MLLVFIIILSRNKIYSQITLKRNEGTLDNHTTSLIHDANDEIDDMEETKDAILVNKEKF